MKFDDILAGCIEAIEQGTTVEECLQRYPTHAAALEPLLTMVVSLAHESKTQISSQAFARGRTLLAARTRQRQLPQDAIAIQHRRPPAPGAPQLRSAPGFPAQHNGSLPRRRLWSAKRAHRGWGIPRFLGIALLLMLIMGATTFIRSVVVSLPGAPFYSVKNTGEQVIEILMKAAGEDLAWHAGQTERRLQEMARLPQAEIATVQTLSRATEEHWASVLAAVQQLPAEERSVILQARLARLQELEAAWAPLQGATPSVATMTVRKLITAGEQLLAEPAAADILATATDTVTPTALPTNTATPLLQATPTAVQPVLVASATPTMAPTATPAPATATALPPLPPTAVPPVAPLPEITLAIPRQETVDDESTTSDPAPSDPAPSDPEEDEDDSEESPSPPDESVVATPTPPLEPENATPSVTNTVATAMATPVVTAVATADGTLTVIPITEQPSATAEGGTPQATATKTALPPTITPAPELSATSTLGSKPTSPPAATKTPKPTATHADEDETETPDATDASTPAPPTPAPTTQPVINPSPSPQEATISAPATPIPATPIANPTTTARPTMPSGEVTKVVQP